MTKPIERLASALQECLDEAADRGVQQAMESEQRTQERLSNMADMLVTQLAKQNVTLRMIWRQSGGDDRRLPIDD